MKNLTLLLAISCYIFSSFNSFAQNVGINTTGAAPDNSALLDLDAPDKGFLITRADTANIPSPAFGLMTLAPLDSCLYLYNGIKWMGLGGAGNDCSCSGGSGAPSTGTPPSNCGPSFSITDARDNQTYGTVGIGNQCWMSENLAYLPSVVGAGTGSETDPYYYVRNYNGTDVATAKSEINYSTFGVLYNWSAAMGSSLSSSSNPSGVQGPCPSGWHLPSDAEWKELEIHLGMSQADADALYTRGTNEGDKLKASSFGGNNSSGFTGLLGGNRGQNGIFNTGDHQGFWWSAAEDDGANAYIRMVMRLGSDVYRYAHEKGFGFSIRCVKD